MWLFATSADAFPLCHTKMGITVRTGIHNNFGSNFFSGWLFDEQKIGTERGRNFAPISSGGVRKDLTYVF